MKPTAGGKCGTLGAAAACLVVALSASVGAKSLYVVKDLDRGSPIQAYGIQYAAQYLAFQAQSVPTGPDGVGLAIDDASATLFVTLEASGTVALVDARTLAVLGTIPTPGATNLAGIAVDPARHRVYTAERFTNILFVYNWNATARTLTLVETVSLPGVQWAMGIALDPATGRLFVADLASTTVRYFHVATWTLAGSFTVSHTPMGIAFDAPRGLVYTGNAFVPQGSPALLSQFNVLTGVERSINLRALTGDPYDCVLGIATDPDTGRVYITTGNESWGGTSCIMAFDRNLAKLYQGPPLGNPTGICVPTANISCGNQPPVAVAGPPQLIEQSSFDGGTVTLNGTASYDPDGDPLTYTWTWPGGSAAGPTPVVLMPHGATTITLVVNDGYGDSEPATTTVIVCDGTCPVLIAPANVTAEQTSRNGTPVALGKPLAADVCDADLVIANNAPEVFPLGTTLVTWTATDHAGNVATATQTVTIVDTTPPSITSLWANPSVLWPVNHAMIPIAIGITIEDTCDAAPTWRIVRVTSSEPDDARGGCNGGGKEGGKDDGKCGAKDDGDGRCNGDRARDRKEAPKAVGTCGGQDGSKGGCTGGGGDGNTSPDIQITGDHTLKLRAERSGNNKAGRIYTITLAVTDASGNTSAADLLVTVRHNQGTKGGGK